MQFSRSMSVNSFEEKNAGLSEMRLRVLTVLIKQRRDYD